MNHKLPVERTFGWIVWLVIAIVMFVHRPILGISLLAVVGISINRHTKTELKETKRADYVVEHRGRIVEQPIGYRIVESPRIIEQPR